MPMVLPFDLTDEIEVMVIDTQQEVSDLRLKIRQLRKDGQDVDIESEMQLNRLKRDLTEYRRMLNNMRNSESSSKSMLEVFIDWLLGKKEYSAHKVKQVETLRQSVYSDMQEMEIIRQRINNKIDKIKEETIG